MSERQEWIRALEPCGASGVVLTPGRPTRVSAHDGAVLVGARVAVYCAPPATDGPVSRAQDAQERPPADAPQRSTTKRRKPLGGTP
jgi:hypothetical protein